MEIDVILNPTKEKRKNLGEKIQVDAHPTGDEKAEG
jgi:hypothetical protein